MERIGGGGHSSSVLFCFCFSFLSDFSDFKCGEWSLWWLALFRLGTCDESLELIFACAGSVLLVVAANRFGVEAAVECAAIKAAEEVERSLERLGLRTGEESPPPPE